MVTLNGVPDTWSVSWAGRGVQAGLQKAVRWSEFSPEWVDLVQSWGQWDNGSACWRSPGCGSRIRLGCPHIKIHISLYLMISFWYFKGSEFQGFGSEWTKTASLIVLSFELLNWCEVSLWQQDDDVSIGFDRIFTYAKNLVGRTWLQQQNLICVIKRRGLRLNSGSDWSTERHFVTKCFSLFWIDRKARCFRLI